MMIQNGLKESLHDNVTDFNQRLNFAETSPLHGKFPTSKDLSPKITSNFQKASNTRPQMSENAQINMHPEPTYNLTK